LLLATLQQVADGEGDSGTRAGALRWEAETRPLWVLADVENRALALAEGLCWASLQRGDTAAFERRARMAERLFEFGVCAELLQADDHTARN
jgi:hypothetical protein